MAIRGGGSRMGGGHSRSSGGSRSFGSRSSRPVSSRIGSSRPSGVRIGGFRIGHSPRIHTSTIIVGGGGKSGPQTLFSKIFTVIFVAFFISLFVFVPVSIAKMDNSQILSVLKQDYAYYHSMASRAQNNSNYKTSAEITNILINPNGEKYCIEYKYNSISYSQKMYSFYVYTLEDLQNLNYEVGSIIYVATESTTVSSLTDSVPMDYLNTTLKDDEEYTSAKKKEVSLNIIIVVAAIVIVGVTAIVIVKVVKSHKKEEVENKEQETQKQAEANKKRICSYCGAHTEEGINECEYCGSKKFEYK